MEYLSKIIFIIISLMVFNSVGAQTNEIIETSKPAGWLKGAQNILAGPAGQMVIQVAKELISRSTGNSQILSLNLSNLFVLVLLKALIFSVGLIGAGHWNHYARRRISDDDDSFMEFGEPSLFVAFLAAQGSGQDGCLQKAACRSPRLANEYARAANALLQGIEMFKSNISGETRYNELIAILERGAYEGHKGAPCNLIYRCSL